MAGDRAERAFAMADIAGSSRLWNRYPDRMSEALARHDGLAATAVADGGGEIFKHTGDGFLASFTDVPSAVRSMVAYQEALAPDSWPTSVEIRSRVCIHRGRAEKRSGDWFGPTINHLARMTDLVAPTHVVLSAPANDALDEAGVLVDPLGAFSVRDLPEPVPLYSVRLDQAVGPALTVAAGRGLVEFKTPFVGRIDELEALSELVEHHRLVTVCGFGGMGKTRLAVEVARRWADTHGASAHFVDLGASEDPMTTVAEAIGLPNAIRGSLGSSARAIAKHVSDRPVLLVLDNCEPVIDAAATTCDALTDTHTGLRILATSREAMELDDEAVFHLGALPLEAAAALLGERAAAIGWDEIDPRIVARLCERVELMPLGIEFVVARLRQIGPTEELAEALDESFDELRGRRRGPDGRHATMRALIESSYAPLSGDEQTLLMRLCQFVGPWPRSAARALGSGLPPDLLDELVAKSLVTPDRAGHLRILEPVREFCLGELADDPEATAAARDALVDWAIDVVPVLDDDRDPVLDVQATRGLVDQLANIRAAVSAASARGRYADEAALMVGLWPLSADGRARSWFGPQIEDTLSRTVDPRQRRALIRLALADTTERHVDVEREERLLALLRELDPDNTSAEFAFVQSNRAVEQVVVDRVLGLDPDPTRQLLLASADTAARKGRRLDEGLARLFASFSYLLEPDLATAIDLAEQAANILRRIHFASAVGLADATAALAREGTHDFDTALAIAQAAVPLAEHARFESSVRVVHAVLLGRVGRFAEARRAASEVIDLALDQAVPFVIFDATIGVAAIHAVEGRGEASAEALDLAGVGRTPLTIALLYELAAEVGFDPGLDRFVESLDPEAVGRRADRAAAFLREARAGLT